MILWAPPVRILLERRLRADGAPQAARDVPGREVLVHLFLFRSCKCGAHDWINALLAFVLRFLVFTAFLLSLALVVTTDNVLEISNQMLQFGFGLSLGYLTSSTPDGASSDLFIIENF